ncbi:MAG: precorrin-6y C5,15-methyltransferase (decarboxylating) subunit CbiE [Deltaproteobacteria bacterium]|nr:precorrin-6y C5,15-methyltransferase (decarboxylating) subunit CbiE [Deltaproteobacteria bacterium]
MIYIIGIGVTGRASLTGRPLDIIRNARLLVGGARHLAEFNDIEAKKTPIGKDLEGVATGIAACAKKGGVAVLATGDPTLYGIAGFLTKRFGKERVEIIPNVSVVQEAFARIKESANGVFVTSGHGHRGLSSVISDVMRHDKTAIFTDAENSPSVIAKALLEAKAGGFDAYVCEAIGSAEERITKGTLESVSRKKRFNPLNTMILIRTSPAESGGQRRIGIPDAGFRHRPGMITKEELRVIVLAKMDVRTESMVWDIGSCSGSVAIESARLAVNGRVWAVEKDARRCADIRANRKRFGASNLEVIRGVAPGCLRADMLEPDAVFVGGGGAGITGILRDVSGRLKRGGRLVASAVTIETAHGVTAFLKDEGYEARDAALVSLAKARDAGVLSILAAHNPIFIISGVKP